MKKFFLFILAAVTGIMSGMSKNYNSDETYNMARGLEEVNAGDADKAEEYFQKETYENPKNGYAYAMLAAIYYSNENYTKSLNYLDKALSLIPKKDKTYRSGCFVLSGENFAELGDTVRAIDNFNQALKSYPKNIDAYEQLGEIYYRQEKYDLSDEQYNQIIKYDPTYGFAYLGLARNAKIKKEYPLAIEYIQKAQSFDPEDHQGYGFLAEIYLFMEDYNKSAENLVKTLNLGFSEKTYYLLRLFPEDQLPLLIAHLKKASKDNPYSFEWPYYMGVAYDSHDKYDEAIESFLKAAEINEIPVIHIRLGDVYRRAGRFPESLEQIETAIQMNPEEDSYLDSKAKLLFSYGEDAQATLNVLSEIIERNPIDEGAYFSLAQIYYCLEQFDKALENINMSIYLSDGYDLLDKCMKIKILREMGRDDEADMLIPEIILHPNLEDYEFKAVFYLAAGQEDKAVENLNEYIEKNYEDTDSYYLIACAYSLMGEYDKALDYLRMAVDNGLNVRYYLLDPDIKDLIETEAFKQYYEHLKNKMNWQDIELITEFRIEKDSDDDTAYHKGRGERSEVPFTPQGGVVSVKCTINELPLSFIFDTGASTVSISQLEANFMLKNGYLNKNDIVGTNYFIDANGDVSEGTVINLREVEFGGFKLNNIQASVVRNQKAPLLLGQSVLGRLGSIEIDNPNRKLIITQ